MVLEEPVPGRAVAGGDAVRVVRLDLVALDHAAVDVEQVDPDESVVTRLVVRDRQVRRVERLDAVQVVVHVVVRDLRAGRPVLGDGVDAVPSITWPPRSSLMLAAPMTSLSPAVGQVVAHLRVLRDHLAAHHGRAEPRARGERHDCRRNRDQCRRPSRAAPGELTLMGTPLPSKVRRAPVRAR
jgi:hypothetical protein